MADAGRPGDPLQRARARVVLDSSLPQLDRLFDYAIPDHLAETAVPGVRVKVPLRSAGRTAEGFIVEVVPPGSNADEYKGALSPIETVVSPIPVLAPEVYRLARRAADRAAGAATDIIRLAVPGRQVRVEKQYLAREAPEPAAPVRVVPIEGYGDGVLEAALAAGERLAVDAVPFPREIAVDRGQSASTGGGDAEPEWSGGWVGGWAVTMAAAAAATVASGKSAILAVPDYRDQLQLEAALRVVLPPERIASLDARQSNPDRYRAFLRCLDPSPLAIVGNRSVVYAPAAELGLIALWDDGDPLFTEPLSPYVHARDAALLRQEEQGGALMFVSHSRSTEVERLVELGWLRAVSPKPPVTPKVVPTAQQAGGDRLAAQARIPSSAWRTAREALEHGPVLVQVARPGYAPGLACVDCGQLARCLRCEGPISQKSARATPSCSWCGALAVGWHCTNCEGERMRFIGQGATRTAEDLGRAFPGVRVIIADGERTVLSVGPEPALVIATRGAEPVAAGGYRAVLLLDGERMVARESLRVGEDCLRWWSNATALAGRGATTVLVGIGGPLATAMATWRQADYARAELADRRRLRFPPAVRVATVTGDVDAVAKAVAAAPIDAEDVLGPVDVGERTVRTIARFDYAEGAAVASALRAQVIKAATAKRRPGVARPTTNLKVRFDDVEPFLEA